MAVDHYDFIVCCGCVLLSFVLSLSLCCFAAVVVGSVVGGGVPVPVDGSFCPSFHVKDPSSRDGGGKGAQCEDLITCKDTMCPDWQNMCTKGKT
jgi:hypothetical protein